MMSGFLIGVVSGVVSSFIVLMTTMIYEYILRKSTEKCKIYELEHVGERDSCAPPEYARETEYVEPKCDEGVSEDCYEMVDIVKLIFPFDVKEIEILEHGTPIYPTDDIKYLPAGEPIYVNCKLNYGDDEPAFVVKCKTFKHEYREYKYTTVYKYSGGISRFGLKMTKQRFTL